MYTEFVQTSLFYVDADGFVEAGRNHLGNEPIPAAHVQVFPTCRMIAKSNAVNGHKCKARELPRRSPSISWRRPAEHRGVLNFQCQGEIRTGTRKPQSGIQRPVTS